LRYLSNDTPSQILAMILYSSHATILAVIRKKQVAILCILHDPDGVQTHDFLERMVSPLVFIEVHVVLSFVSPYFML